MKNEQPLFRLQGELLTRDGDLWRCHVDVFTGRARSPFAKVVYSAVMAACVFVMERCSLVMSAMKCSWQRLLTRSNRKERSNESF